MSKDDKKKFINVSTPVVSKNFKLPKIPKDDIQKDIDRAREENNTFLTKFGGHYEANEIEIQHDKSVEYYESAIKKLTDQFEAMETKYINELEDEHFKVHKLKDKIRELEDIIKGKEGSLYEKYTERLHETSTAWCKVEKAENKIKELEQEKKLLEEEIDGRVDELNHLEEQIRMLSEDTANLYNEIDTLEYEIRTKDLVIMAERKMTKTDANKIKELEQENKKIFDTIKNNEVSIKQETKDKVIEFIQKNRYNNGKGCLKIRLEELIKAIRRI
jgi:chromosome segregation ATPase